MSRNRIIEGAAFDVKLLQPDDPQTRLSYMEEPAEQLMLPTYDEMIVNYPMFPEAVPTLLAEAVSESLVSAFSGGNLVNTTLTRDFNSQRRD